MMNKTNKEIERKILKAVLMLKRLIPNHPQTKEDLIKEQLEWYTAGFTTDEMIDEWIDALREDMKKTPEQREEENRIDYEENAVWTLDYEISERYYRDEWDDLWLDRARECGARIF